jgi:hypothetical protein
LLLWKIQIRHWWQSVSACVHCTFNTQDKLC